MRCNDSLLNRKQAAEVLRIQVQMLSAWICRGGGPPYAQVCRCVRCRLADLEKWVSAWTVDRDEPPLRPSEEEMGVRREAQERLFAKYGPTSRQNAPDEALRDHLAFLRTRMGSGK